LRAADGASGALRSVPSGLQHTRRDLLARSAKAALAAAVSALPGSLLLGCGRPQALPSATSTAPILGNSRRIDGPGSLRARAAAKRLLTGFAVAPNLLRTDSAYASVVREQASIIVAENAMKWDAMRPSATTFNFDAADALLNFAEQNRIKLRGHNLLWHRQIPPWFTAMANPANARNLLESHIETVAGRYASRMHSWDVVNEAIQVSDGRPDGLRDSPWLRLVGDDYIEIAFNAARRADPQALLTYNDYGIEAESPADEAKRQAILLMLRRMRTRRVPIDAVGIQSHLSAAGPRYGNGLMRFIASLRELDLQVFLTEMDVNDRALAPPIAQRDAAVAATYSDYLDLVLADPAVTAALFWGVSDRDTWLNHEDARPDGKPERPLLFDSNFKPKPSFFAACEAFDGRTIRAHG
jgi:endo-1,4-beta-xylanase